MRKNFLSVLSLLIFSLYFAAAAHAGLTKIADGVYGYVDIKDASPEKGFGANTGVIVRRDGKDYLLVFDKKAKELCASSWDIDFISTEMKKSLPKRDELELLIKANIDFKYFLKK